MRDVKHRGSEPNPMTPDYTMRRRVLLGFLSLGVLVLLASAMYRQVVRTEYLQDKGENRYLRVRTIPVSRGEIRDRNGLPLALSAPVYAVTADPRRMPRDAELINPLAHLLGMSPGELSELLASRSDKHFVYLKRGVLPELAERAAALVNKYGKDIVELRREYRRYYPDGEVAAQITGLTDTDEKGVSGIEKLRDDWLTGTPGQRLVLQDRLERVVDEVESISPPHQGGSLTLSLDRRLQFLAYRELKRAVNEHQATSGSAVILDAVSAEVLALVNQPSFNPNDRTTYTPEGEANRGVTKVFEPGSTIKPFLIAAALDAGLVTPETMVDTAPGYISVGRSLIKDHHNYGLLDVTGILTKSSNVGVIRLARQLEPEYIWRYYRSMGIGDKTGIHFIGEKIGTLRHYSVWYKSDHSSHAYGYGLAVTPVQLARAYGVLAADGVLRDVSLEKLQQIPQGRRVMPVATARQVRRMLETVVSPAGTGRRAAVEGYRVAGKTGTSKLNEGGVYLEKSYRAVFAGMIPATRPRLVMAVVIDDPKGGEYYGGVVAAPVFARVMEGAMRILSVAPDDLPPPRLVGLGARP